MESNYLIMSGNALAEMRMQIVDLQAAYRNEIASQAEIHLDE